MNRWITSGALLASLAGVGASLAGWKYSSLNAADAASAQQPSRPNR